MIHPTDTRCSSVEEVRTLLLTADTGGVNGFGTGTDSDPEQPYYITGSVDSAEAGYPVWYLRFATCAERDAAWLDLTGLHIHEPESEPQGLPVWLCDRCRGRCSSRTWSDRFAGYYCPTCLNDLARGEAR